MNRLLNTIAVTGSFLILLLASPAAFSADGAMRLGPHLDCRELLVRSIRAGAGRYDSSKTYAHIASQGYLLAAIGLALQSDDPLLAGHRKEFVALGLRELEELAAVENRVLSGGPAFGLDRDFDAFGDGTINPAFTGDTFQSGMVVWGAMTFLHTFRTKPELAPENARAILNRVARWIAYWEPFYTGFEEDGQQLGYFWYSDSTNDRGNAVHNTSALIAMAASLWSELTPGDPEAVRLGKKADAYFRYFQARLRKSPSGGYVWNYWDEGAPLKRRRPEDISHAIIDAQTIRRMHDLGRFTEADMKCFGVTLINQIWKGGPLTLAADVAGGGTAKIKYINAVPVLFATLADRVPDPSLTWEMAASIFFTACLSERVVNPSEGTVDMVKCLALARLLETRPKDPPREWTAGEPPLNIPLITLGPEHWEEAKVTEAGYPLSAHAATGGAEFTVHPPQTGGDEAASVSIIWAGSENTKLTTPGGLEVQLAATFDEKGQLRWHRTTFVPPAAGALRFRVDKPIRLHRVIVRHPTSQ